MDRSVEFPVETVLSEALLWRLFSVQPECRTSVRPADAKVTDVFKSLRDRKRCAGIWISDSAQELQL